MAQSDTGRIHRLGNRNGFRLRKAAAVAVAGMLGAVSMVFSPVASAHDVVMGSTPENGSVLEEFPEVIELEFSGIPQDLFNTVALSNADTGDVLYSGAPDLNGRLITFEVPDDIERVPGSYTVGFQITSSDGHSTKGSVSFDVAGGEEVAAEPAASTEVTDGISETTGIEAPWNWVLSGVAVLVIAGAIVMMIAKGRNSK